MYDSGAEDPDRFFMFGTDKNVKCLEEANIYADGTFDIAPELFQQVYTVHALVQGRCLPMVYGILPRKTEVIYTKFLNELKKRVVLMPKTINSDFEVSFINACLKVFPSVLIYLCFFHFN